MKLFNSLGHQGEGSLKQRIRIEFVNAEGLTEAGVDGMFYFLRENNLFTFHVGGGLFKDFVTDLVKTAFYQYALFLSTSDRKLYPNPSSSFLSIDIQIASHYAYLSLIYYTYGTIRIFRPAYWKGVI